MPVYNNEKTLAKAIESIRNDSEVDYKIILSDDGSTDGSWDLCAKYAAIDERVEAIKQPTNLYYNNFRFVLDAANTPYFCWLAGDDYFAKGFLSKAIATLEEQVEAVAAIGTCLFYHQDEFIGEANGSYAIIQDTANSRLVEYFSKATDNSRMYGVFRTEAARLSFPHKLFHAYDWAFSALTLTYGRHVDVGVNAIHRDKTDRSAYRKMVRKDAKNIISRLFPLFPMTSYLLTHKQINNTWPFFKSLFRLNFNSHLNYCEMFHPRYYKAVIFVQNEYASRIGWRFKRHLK
nr:glycosyltransferase [Paraglaciecola sp. MB-3u-78]